MSTTTPPPQRYRVIATSIRPVNHINLAAVAAGGGVPRDERLRPEMRVQMWVDTTVPLARHDLHDGYGFYTGEIRYGSREEALAALPLLVACNTAVSDGVKRLKVVEA